MVDRHIHNGLGGDAPKIRAQDIDGLAAFIAANTTQGVPVFGTSSRTVASGTGDQAITGIGFQPRYIRITAVIDSVTNGGVSIGIADADLNVVVTVWYAREVASYPLTVQQSSGGNIIQALAYGTHSNLATLSSIDADGFTLNWNNIDDTTEFTYECYP